MSSFILPSSPQQLAAVDALWEFYFDMSKLRTGEILLDLGSEISISMNPANIAAGDLVQVRAVSDSGKVFHISATCTSVDNNKLHFLVLTNEPLPSINPPPDSPSIVPPADSSASALIPADMFVHKLNTARRLVGMVGAATRTELAMATLGVPFPRFMDAVSHGAVDAAASGTLECRRRYGRGLLKKDLEDHCAQYVQAKVAAEARLGDRASMSAVVAIDKEMAGMRSEIEGLQDRIRALKRKRADLSEKRSVYVALCDNDRAVRRFRRRGLE